MSKSDLNSLGSVYGSMLNGLKRDLIKEGKVGPGDIGEAELEDGGPEAADGFAEAEVDVEKLSDKEKEENLYDINKHSYTHKYVPATAEEDEEVEGDAEEDVEEDEEKPDYIDVDEDGDTEESMKKAVEDADDKEEDEESEESSQISEKIAQDSLNNFMKQKSAFDKFYDKVMVSENLDEMESEDFDALGLDDATPDEEVGGEDEVTITVPKDVAKTLCDLLQGAMGEDDLEDGAEEGAFGEEDEEGIDTGSTLNTSYDDGKNNKVGDLKTAAAASETCCDNEIDAGSTHSGAYDDGKNNKVGSLKSGDRAVD